jgi:hypothetical protein
VTLGGTGLRTKSKANETQGMDPVRSSAPRSVKLLKLKNALIKLAVVKHRLKNPAKTAT